MPATTERAKPHAPKSKVAALKIFSATKRSQKPITITSAAVGTALKIRAEIERLEKQLASMNFASAPKVTLPELHDKKTGRIDAQKVADFVSVPLKPLAEGLGLNYKAVHHNPSATSFQEALRPVKRSLELLQEFVGPPTAIRAWLNTPHPDLGGSTALETILEGKSDAVLLILENAWSGVPV